MTPLSFALRQTAPEDFTQALMADFMKTGFSVISDHGIDLPLIDKVNAASAAFFALDRDVKQRYFDPDGAGQRGYTPFGQESAKGVDAIDLKEFWHTGRRLADDHPLSSSMPPTPAVAEIEDFDDATDSLFNAFDTFGITLLESVAEGLDLPTHFFTERVSNGNSILRLLHYPPHKTPPPEGSIRAAAHEDINVITLLLGADEAGLEIRPKDETDFQPIHAPPGTVVVNVGDMLQRLTNGILQSTTHRVVNPSPERSKYSRYSMPFFLHFEPDVSVNPMEQCVTSDRPLAFPEKMTANDYLFERLRELGLLKD